MAWYETGVDVHHKEMERRKKAKEEGGDFDRHNIYRYFIPQSATGKEHKVLFLDDDPLSVYMHHYQHHGKWGNWAACPKECGVSSWCPLCDRKDTWTTLIAHYTIIDVSGWMKDGKRRMALKILPAKSQLAIKLDDRRDRFGTLVGALFAVKRTTDDAVNTGDDWIYEGRVHEGEGGLKKFMEVNKEALSPSLDYLPEEYGFWKGKGDDREYFIDHGLPFDKVLEPLTAEALQEKLTGGGSSDSGGDYSDSQPDNNPSY